MKRAIQVVCIVLVVLFITLWIQHTKSIGRSMAHITTTNTLTKWQEDDAPGCIMEPSNNAVGYEVIHYNHLWEDDDYEGFIIPCLDGSK